MTNSSCDCTTQVKVLNAMGLHARPAAQIARMVSNFSAQVELIKIFSPNERANCSSVLEMLILAAGKGTELTIVSQGSDAQQALECIEQYFRDGFDEDIEQE